MRSLTAAVQGCFHRRAQVGGPQVSHTLAEIPLVVPVLLGSASEGSRQTFQQVLHDTRWTLLPGNSWRDMLGIPLAVACPVIVYDIGFAGPPWQEAIARLAAHWGRPSVIALAQEERPRLREEALAAGAFEVLTYPLEKEAILRLLNLAHEQWRNRRGRPVSAL